MSHPDDRLRAALAAIASVCLDALPNAQLGGIVLRDDQRRIVARAQRALVRDGGCLIAEGVGRGKTYVALALATQWGAPLVVAPAALRTTWASACRRAQVDATIISHESLSRNLSSRAQRLPRAKSRGGTCSSPPFDGIIFDGIIVDESHHFRTPTTRRHAALARLATRAPIVMLSATPLQNRERDLAAQLSLYLGEMAFSLAPASLARFVIRGDDTDAIEDMPVVSAPKWVDLDADDSAVLRAILALAPPAKPLDGGDAGVLRTINLVRAWASSRAALEATLRSRRRLAAAVEQGFEAGRAPTRREIRAWHAAEGVVQLGFASLLMDGTPTAAALGELRLAIERERDTLAELSRVLRNTPDPDVARVSALRRIRAEHPRERVIAFSEFASTITSLYSAMRVDAGVGMLTAREARIASGRISRDDLLARFAPLAQHATATAAHESVTLLLATDLLSEGVNLQDASVVVHLDLPWNPARLAQRVGRVRRPGGARVVRAYLLSPPARASELLDADARLRRKLAAAERVVGHGIHVLPALSSIPVALHRAESSSADAHGMLTAQLERWRSREAIATCSGAQRIVAGVESETRAWLAALSDGRLISSFDGSVSDSVSSALRAVELLEGPSRIANDDETRAALASVHTWFDAERLAESCGLDSPHGPLRLRVLRWLATLPSVIGRHQRAAALPIIAHIRDQLQRSLPLGVELALTTCFERGGDLLAQLACMAQVLDDVRWRTSAPAHDTVHVIALIVIGPSNA